MWGSVKSSIGMSSVMLSIIHSAHPTWKQMLTVVVVVLVIVILLSIVHGHCVMYHVIHCQ